MGTRYGANLNTGEIDAYAFIRDSITMEHLIKVNVLFFRSMVKS